MEKDIYPLTIIKDRYTGCYSGGEYTAWNLDFYEIPADIDDEDVECKLFWDNNTIPVGKGETPEEAIKNLEELLKGE